MRAKSVPDKLIQFTLVLLQFTSYVSAIMDAFDTRL